MANKKKMPWRLAVLAGACAWLALLAGCSRSPTPADATSDNPAILIEPRVAVGKIKAGMTVSQIIAELGQPQRRTAAALEYTNLGLAVMYGPDQIVQVVMCGDVTGLNGPFVKLFNGRTKEGIGMNSTRDELLKTYGEPTSMEKMRMGLESIKYDPLGITFTLEGGKVHHMIVRLGGTNAEPDRTVSLEPAATNR